MHARTLPVRVDGFFHSCFSGHRQRAQSFFPNPVASRALYVYRWKTSPKGVVLVFHFIFIQERPRRNEVHPSSNEFRILTQAMCMTQKVETLQANFFFVLSLRQPVSECAHCMIFPAHKESKLICVIEKNEGDLQFRIYIFVILGATIRL